MKEELHELLRGTTLDLELTGLDYKEIDRRLKALDAIANQYDVNDGYHEIFMRVATIVFPFRKP